MMWHFAFIPPSRSLQFTFQCGKLSQRLTVVKDKEPGKHAAPISPEKLDFEWYRRKRLSDSLPFQVWSYLFLSKLNLKGKSALASLFLSVIALPEATVSLSLASMK